MKLTFHKKDSDKSYTIHINQNDPHSLWIKNEIGEGSSFNLEEVTDMIYGAIDKYFQENH